MAAMVDKQVLDDVGILEAALERASERKRAAQAASWTPRAVDARGAPLGGRPDEELRVEPGLGTPLRTGTEGLPTSVASVSERERFGQSVSAYSAQLKAWVDLQVDMRLKLVLPGVEEELAAVRQESFTALEMSQAQQARLEKIESLVLTVDEISRKETADLQQETLATVQRLMSTVDDLKQSVSLEKSCQLAKEQQRGEDQNWAQKLALQESTIEDFRKRHVEHANSLAEVCQLHREHRKELDDLLHSHREAHQQRLAECRADLGAQLAQADRVWKQQGVQKKELEGLQREINLNVQAELESLRLEIHTAAKHSDLEEVQRLFEKSQRRLGDNLVAHQQKLVSELRAETTTAFKNEAAAVTTLDEQLWTTDKRLGQRIDKMTQDLAESNQNYEKCIEDLARSHEECLRAIRTVARSSRDGNRWQSPEPRQNGPAPFERAVESLSPRLSPRSVEEQVQAETLSRRKVRPETWHGFSLGSLDKSHVDSWHRADSWHG